ncbi:putative fmp40 found in mitochondrial proteome [Rosellinia necatrix]|uniref:Selenoprotein O n=1 Tax=Rosellinia necatrix TaxID=77044 RepID=A0A1W2TCD9_ROSNE|nr:putative fmp40 found in mitochondrial proteome [Rosellinia necatrix]
MLFSRILTRQNPRTLLLSRSNGPFRRALLQRAQHMTASTADGAPAAVGASINDIPKSWNLTSKLPADGLYPTPADSDKTPRGEIRPRTVRDAIFTWVRPQPVKEPELLAVSPAGMRDLGIRPGDEESADFVATVAGNKIQGWDEERREGGYPWAQCYGGFQFGSWAGQLGDGRAISLFETTNPQTNVRYELQLKGAGMTPYSRFADGKAVLRSSIREFVVSEALNALGIPTTRALSLTLLPHEKVRREMIEPGAIVARFAQTWLRIGNFDILRSRGDRKLIRQLASYLAEDVFGGWETLPARLQDPDKPTESPPPERGVPSDALEGPPESAENRFTRLYREIVRRNALTVAKWQAYGFMNGVLNTDNTSLFGLSIDFGPFAFMDNFDPMYTPNHDDSLLRYSYRNQPSIIWWNLVRLGESLGELLGAGKGVDDEKFVNDGVTEDQTDELVARAEKLIKQAGEEYKAVFLGEYKRVMTARLGLKNFKESDFDQLFSELLDTMEALELDFNLFFRRLSTVKISELDSEQARHDKASVFFYQDGVTGLGGEEEGRKRVGAWLEIWRQRILEDWGNDSAVSEEADSQRTEAMKKVNPSFIPRGWILDEVIRRVEKEKERDILDRVMTMALHPFEDSWAGRDFDGKTYDGDKEEETRWISDVPKVGRALQCSCSS